MGKRNRPTDGRTDGRLDGRPDRRTNAQTHPLKKMQERIQKVKFPLFQLVCDLRTDGLTEGRTDGHTLFYRCENTSKRTPVEFYLYPVDLLIRLRSNPNWRLMIFERCAFFSVTFFEVVCRASAGELNFMRSTPSCPIFALVLYILALAGMIKRKVLCV